MLCGFLILGCQDPVEKEKSKYREEMENYIDSIEDDFGSYEFIDMGLDTVNCKEFYESLIDSNFMIYKNRGFVYKWRQEYRDDYKRCTYTIKDKTWCWENYGGELTKWNKIFEYDSLQISKIENNIIQDSIKYVEFYLNYKIKNENGGIEKKHVSKNLNSYSYYYDDWFIPKGLRSTGKGYYTRYHDR